MRTQIQTRENKQPILPKTKQGTKSTQSEIKIINLAIHLEKLTAQLSDGRELSIPIDWFAKWGIENVGAEKLRKYEIKRGVNVYFPDIDEVLGIEAFIHGFDAPCE